MVHTKLIELRPDRSLLDPNFNGYKLSLEQPEITQEKLDKSVDRALLSSDAYSFIHAKLFGMHNHLVGETINDKSSVYFVNNDWEIQKAYLDEITQTINDLVEVWKIPRNRDREQGDYNISILFASETLAVVSDGTGLLYILKTGSRNDDAYWQVEFKDEVLHPNKPFIIHDICLKFNSNKQPILHCLLVNIEQETAQNDKHFTCVRWISLSNNNENSWGITATREFKCKGGVHYAYFEPEATAFYIISDNEVECTLDSELPVTEKKSLDTPQKTYLWVQSQDDIVLKFRLPTSFVKDHFSFSVEPLEINLKYRDKNLIVGKLFNRVDSELTTWATNDHFLEITMTKSEKGLMWPEVVQGDENGEHVPDPNVIDDIHQRLAHFCTDEEVSTQQCPGGATFNSQQVEDCDFENDQLSYFQRVSITHEITHKANIGSHQVLLTVKLEESLPPAFATRHDVDACLWQPISEQDNVLRHVGTLFAFGYIQASKQQRKFSVCAPNLSYSVICDSTTHLFVYRQNKSVTGGRLRNRTTGTNVDNIAQQQVINIPKDEEVIGIYAVNRSLFLLTEKTIMAIKM